MSVGIQFLSPDLVNLQKRLDSLNDKSLRNALEMIGGIVESQTRRRIHDEKTAPDGQHWQAWSDAYAATRHGNQSLLFASGDLEDSIQYEVVGFELYWGSNLKYANNQNEGTTVPKREYLGLSLKNEYEIVEALDNYFDSLLKGKPQGRA